MHHGGAIVQIERPILVLVDEFKRRLQRPIGIMRLVGGVDISRVDMFRPGKAALPDPLPDQELPGLPFGNYVWIRRIIVLAECTILRDDAGYIHLGTDVQLAYMPGYIARQPKRVANIHIVVLQPHIEFRRAVQVRRVGFQIFRPV